MVNTRFENPPHAAKTFGNTDDYGAIDGSISPPPELLKAAREFESKFASMIVRARELERFKVGRSPTVYNVNLYVSMLPAVQNSREVRHLLSTDSFCRAILGDVDGALQSARAMLAISRAIGDELSLISQVARIACVSDAVHRMMFAVDRGGASALALEQTQAALTQEKKTPYLLIGARAERAALFDTLQKIGEGKIDRKFVLKTDGDDADKRKPSSKPDPVVKYDLGFGLAHMNTAVEIAKKPTWLQAKDWVAWDLHIETNSPKSAIISPALSCSLFPAIPAIRRNVCRVGSVSASCETILGYKRFRMKHGHWPTKPEELATVFPEGVPIDPFSGQPMICRIGPKTLVVYSVSLDEQDNGGNLENYHFEETGTDIGFRFSRDVKN